MKILVNEPALDYITLTTFQQEKYFQLKEYVQNTIVRSSLKVESVEAQLLQYSGHWLIIDGNKQVFIGKGEQNKTAHFIIRISGSSTIFMEEWINDPNNTQGWSCTRVDTQLTMPYCEDPSLISTHFQDLNNKQFHAESIRKPRGRKIQWFTDNEGNDTLYIGSINSDRKIRIYKKKTQEGEQEQNFIRCEVELKGKQAQSWLKSTQTKPIKEILLDVLTSSINSVVYTPLLTSHRVYCQGNREGWTATWAKSNTHTTLQWFEDACVACADRLLDDEQTRERFLKMIQTLQNKAEYIKRKQQPPQPPKRGRGRPRKNTMSDQDQF